MPIYSEDYYGDPSTINLLNFIYFNSDTSYELLEDNYENIKNFKHIYFDNYQNTLFNSLNFLTPVSYVLPLDSFRADYDENN
jgi:hypothetical protein